MTAAAPLSFSTNVAWAAPRDSASMPAAPRPGEQVEDVGARQVRVEDREQRLLDPVGQRARARTGRLEPDAARRPGDDPAGVAGRHVPLAGSPAATRRSQPSSSSAARAGRGGSSRPSASSSASACVRARTASSRCSATWSDATRRRGKPLWARPEDVALLAQLEVLLGELEPVVRLDDGAQAGHRDLVGRIGHQHAERFDAAAPDPAAELVELGQAEPVGALDDHHRRRRHVDPDLDDRRPDQDVQLAVAEPAHLGVTLGRLEPAVDHPDPERVEQRGQPDRLALGRDAPSPSSTPSSISGTTTNVRWPSAASSRTFRHVPSRSAGRLTPSGS